MTKLEEIARRNAQGVIHVLDIDANAAMLAAMLEMREELAQLAASMYLYSGVDIADAIRRWGEE